MAPQLADAVDEYGITVISSGGYDSCTYGPSLVY